MSEYVLRMMDVSDLNQIEEIEKEAYHSSPWSRFAYQEELGDNDMAYYVVLCDATNESKVLGYGGFWQILDEAHITKVTIDRNFRKKGLSKVLLQGMLELAKSMRLQRATLEVRVSNAAAIGLYHNKGFEDSGVRPKYYPDGEDALIMWRDLADVVVNLDE